MYNQATGTRAQVWHGTAYKTTGGLTKKNLFYNSKTGRIVSLIKHNHSKKDNQLARLGYKTTPGVFTPFQKLTRRSVRGRKRRR